MLEVTSCTPQMKKEGDAVDGGEDDPRWSFTGRGQIRGSRSNLREGIAQNEVQQDGDERTVSIRDGR